RAASPPRGTRGACAVLRPRSPADRALDADPASRHRRPAAARRRGRLAHGTTHPGARDRRPHLLRRASRKRRARPGRAAARLLPAGLRRTVIEAVVFDLDGVLLDSEHVWNEVREHLTRERGGRWHEGAQREMMGMSSLEWSRYMHDELGVPDPPDEISKEVVRQLETIYRRRLPAVPGARDAVERLAEHWPLGLASSP